MFLISCRYRVLGLTQKTIPTVFSILSTVLKIFRTQEKPVCRSFFIFQNISKTTNVFKNCGNSFLSYAEY